MSGDELSPYRGLTPFGDSELDVLFFFGRDRDRELVVANLMASRLTVLYGETGVGKSSLLRAGVASHLRGLAEPLAAVVFDEWRGEPAGALARRVAEAADTEVMGSLADTMEHASALLNGELYVILDGFEEYFLYHEGEDGSGRFAVELPEAVRRPGLRASFLVALRADSVAKLDRFKGRIPGLFANYLRLEHLDREAARAAVVGPLERYGELVGATERVEIEPELVEAVLDEVAAGKVAVGQAGQGTVEGGRGDARVETPYLQLVMQRLWDEERAVGSRRLRLSTFRSLGGAEQIVRDHLQLALDELAPPAQDLVAEAFDHLVTPSGTKIAHAAPDLARYAGVEEAELVPVLQTLTEERILRPVADEAGARRYEIYHDILADAVLAWGSAHEAERRVEQERETASRRHRRLVAALGVSVLLLALMAAVTVFALTQRSDARSQARRAHARELDATALSQIESDPQESLSLAVQAAKLQATAQSEDVLRRALLASRLRAVLRAGGPVTAAVYSPDGTRILTGSLDGRARLYDARTHRLLQTFRDGTAITSATLGDDGRLIVTGGRDGNVRVRTLGNGQLLVLRHGAPVWSVALDRRDSLVATTGGTSAKLWRASDGSLLATFPMAKAVTRAVFSPDGRRLAVSGNDQHVLIVDTSSGRVIYRLDHGDRITGAVFSPNSKLLATAGVDGKVQLWSVQKGTRIREYDAQAKEALAAAFSPGGRLLATVHSDGTGRIWDVRSGQLLAPLTGHKNLVDGVAFSPDGNFVVTASRDRTARVWKSDNGLQVALLAGHGESVNEASFGPDGSSVLTASDDGTARIWDPRAQPQLRLLVREPGPVLGAMFAGGDQRVLVVGPGRKVRLVQTPGGATVRTFEAPGPVTAAGVSPDGEVFAVAAGRGVTFFGANGSKAGGFRQPAVITAVAFAPDGEQVATAGRDGVGRIWTTEGRLVRELKGHSSGLTDVTFSPDGNEIATASRDRTARIWKTDSGATVVTLRGHKDDVTSVAFSPDGRQVLTASLDHDARLWDAATGRLVQKLRWAFGRVSDANFSPDGRWIVAANPGTAQLWQPGIQPPLLPFGLGGHLKPLTSAVFDRSSRIILTASQDGTVRTYPCEICGGVDELLPLAERRLAALGR